MMTPITETVKPLTQEDKNDKYSGTPLVRPPLLHQKSGLSRGVACRQG